MSPSHIYLFIFLAFFASQIGQLVFKGMKRLNRIQSIVFETAYNTNENLLICAPTGAGKTNIAMLTVLHEIRQHLQPGGVIKKDEFKVRLWPGQVWARSIVAWCRYELQIVMFDCKALQKKKLLLCSDSRLIHTHTHTLHQTDATVSCWKSSITDSCESYWLHTQCMSAWLPPPLH